MTDARTLLWSARAVLLDFDGPVTPLMPAPLNKQTADAARAALAQRDIDPPEIRETSDHLAVIRWAGAHVPDALPDVEARCTEAEVEAARTSEPTAGAHELIVALDDAGVPVVIVTNNAAIAAWTYLGRFGMEGKIRGIVGRPELRPDLMKPNTHMVEEALGVTESSASETILVGDAVSDVQVAHALGIRAIGFAKNTRRGIELASAGADALVETVGVMVP